MTELRAAMAAAWVAYLGGGLTALGVVLVFVVVIEPPPVPVLNHFLVDARPVFEDELDPRRLGGFRLGTRLSIRN